MAKVKIAYRSRLDRNGKAPIMIAITHKRKMASYMTGYSISPDQWSGRDGSWVIGKNAKSINATLQAMLMQARSELIKQEMLGTTNDMSADEIRDLLSPTRSTKPKDLLVSLMSSYRDAAKTDGYKVLFGRTIKEIEKHYKDVRIGSVNVDWLKSFESKLISEGNKTNTIAIHLRNIRAVVKKAIADEIIDRDPFLRFKIATTMTEERPMTNEEVRLIWTSTLEQWQEEWVALFKLCFYLIGINMVDLSKLNGIDKDGYIRYKRSKTGRDYCIKVEPEAIDIIERYKGTGHLIKCFDRYKDYKQVNKHMMHAVKSIGAPLVDNGSLARNGRNSGPKKLDIEHGPLASVQQYSTRRTWATMAYNECEIGMDVISLCLGHSDGMGMSVTQRYVRPNQSRIDAANRKVLDKLKEICG